MVTRIACFLVYFSCFWGHDLKAATTEDQTPTMKRILVIYGDADIGVWEQNFSTAFHFKLRSHPHVKISPEYLPLNQPNSENLSDYASSIAMRYQGTKYDLVVTIQPAAAEFVIRWGDRFAKNTPKLFVLPGPENEADAKHIKQTSVIRSAWPKATTKTFSAMREIIPDMKKLYVVAGDGKSDISYLNRSRIEIERDKTNIVVEYSSGETIESLLQRFSLPEAQTAVLLLTYSHNKSEKVYRTLDLAKILGRGSRIPIFSTFDSLVDSGIVGGNFTQANLYGEKTADVSWQVLTGEQVDISESKTTYVFDDAAMEKWQLDTDKLPANSTRINQSPPLWVTYRTELICAIAVITVQAIFIFALIRSLKHRRVIERERDAHIEERANQTQLFESVINGISEAVIIIDNEHRIVATNQQGFMNTFGYASAEVMHTPFENLFVENDESKVSNPRDKLLTSISLEPEIHHYINAKHQVFLGETVGTRIANVDGSASGYFALIRDVTARIRREEEQLQGNKMEALGNLAGGIAHDFNNMLMAIIGNVEIASLHIDEPSEVKQSLDRILRAGKRASDLVSQILTFSRRSEGTSLYNTNLKNLMLECEQLLTSSIPSSIEINIKVQSGLWDIEANETQLHQVIMNLCTNSQYAMPDGGHLIINASNRHIGDKLNLRKGIVPKGDYVVLSVADTGSGISQENLTRIFEPFYTTKPPGEGTGMGLALVYGIIKSHYAYLDLQSVESEGTTTTLYFKAQRPQQFPHVSQ